MLLSGPQFPPLSNGEKVTVMPASWALSVFYFFFNSLFLRTKRDNTHERKLEEA